MTTFKSKLYFGEEVKHIKKSGIEYIVGEEDIASTFKSNVRCQAECFDVLKNNGLLPLKHNSEIMTNLNLLANWVFYSGAITSGNGYIQRVIVSPGKHTDEVESIIRNVGFEPDVKRNGKNVLTITKQGSCLGRLLYCMGLPLGKKSKNGLEIPNYILSSPNTDFAKDSVAILLKAKGPIRPYNERMRLFTVKKAETADKLGLQFKSLFRKAGYSEPHFSKDFLGETRGFRTYLSSRSF